MPHEHSALTAAGLIRSAGSLLLAAALLSPAGGVAQEATGDSLRIRWVGTHLGHPLHLDFYADTMLVVNDRHVSDFRVASDSIVVSGDTSFSAQYRFARGHLILTTDSGSVITMSPQGPLARPLRGRWVGTPSRLRDTEIELRMELTGTASWRSVPGGSWIEGEWDRASRIITFIWLPDSTEWIGQYDPMGNQLLFEQTLPEGGVTVLRRSFRRPED